MMSADQHQHEQQQQQPQNQQTQPPQQSSTNTTPLSSSNDNINNINTNTNNIFLAPPPHSPQSRRTLKRSVGDANDEMIIDLTQQQHQKYHNNPNLNFNLNNSTNITPSTTTTGSPRSPDSSPPLSPVSCHSPNSSPPSLPKSPSTPWFANFPTSTSMIGLDVIERESSSSPLSLSFPRSPSQQAFLPTVSHSQKRLNVSPDSPTSMIKLQSWVTKEEEANWDISGELLKPEERRTVAIRNAVSYCYSLLISLLGAVPCVILGLVVARVDWFTITENHTLLNTWNITMFYVFATVFAIIGFCAVKFWSSWGLGRFVQHKYYIVITTGVALASGPYFLFYYIDFAYWYYYIDMFIIAGLYVVTSFVTGYLGCDKELDRRTKIRAGLVFLFSGFFVTATTMMYGMFILMYFGTMSDIVKVVWRLTIHPIYFEILVMIPARVLVKSSVALRCNILSTLLIVHSHSHVYSLGRLMIANINDLPLNVGSTVALNVGKLLLRLSLKYRDEWLEKMLDFFAKFFKADFSPNPTTPTNLQQESQAVIRCVVIISESIMENIAIVSAPLLLYIFQTRKLLFSFPYEGDVITWQFAVTTVAIQLVIGIIFDIFSTILIEIKSGLPLGKVWKMMFKEKFRYFGFLTFGMLTMGITGVLYMSARVPRILYCSNPYDICSCSLNMYCENM